MFARPDWQQVTGLSSLPHSGARLTPDVSADADPATGVRIVFEGKQTRGGGTSQSAPIWAGLTVLMNAYLEDHGGNAMTGLNPLLYRAARDAPSAFHDVSLGGSSVYDAQGGYDYATGLGSPNVDALAPALLAAQRSHG